MGHPRRCSVKVFCNVSKTVVCRDNFDCPLYPFKDPQDWCPVGHVAARDCKTDADCGADSRCINGISQCEYEAPRTSSGHAGDLIGDWVIGQCSLEDGVYNVPTADTFGVPIGIEFDRTPPQRLYVADFFRVVGFEGAAITKSRSAASIVIGQTALDRRVDHVGHRIMGDLTVGGFYHEGPRTIGREWDRKVKAVSTPDMDALWIADDKRVGRFPRRASTNAAMDLVLGTTDFEGVRVANIEGQIEHASDIDAQRRCVDGERIGTPCERDADCPQSTCATTLVISDCGYNRIEVWRRPPKENGAAPDTCLGQPDCSGYAPNRSHGPTADSLSCPRSVAFDSKGNLWVLDGNNHRALRYDHGFTQAAHNATVVFGQESFTAKAKGRSETAITLGDISGAGLDLDSQDNLALVDAGNGRVLFIPPPYKAATRVIGVTSMTDYGPAFSSDGTKCDRLASPRDVVFDDHDNLWVADTNNGRALRFPHDFPATSAEADVMQGQLDCASFHFLGVGPTSFSRGHSHGAAVVRDGKLKGLGCFGDSEENRILCWRNVVAARSGMPPADFVLGQQQFTTYRSNQPSLSASTLYHPALMDFVGTDPLRLMVADRENNRVLGFRAADLRTGAAADLVFGQAGSLTSATCGVGPNVSANTLCEPTSARGDSEGNLWVADYGTGRVLLFCFGAPGSASGICTKDNRGDTTADLVLGKPDMEARATMKVFCTSPRATTLCHPYDVVSDPARKRVIVTDQNPEADGVRVLIYEYPLMNGKASSTVIGIPSGKFDDYASSGFGVCWDGVKDGNACDYLEPHGAAAGSGPKKCVGGEHPHQPCKQDADCGAGGTCGCPSPAICDYSRSLASVTSADSLAIHPQRDILYVGRGPQLLEYRGPLKSGMRAEQIAGYTTPHNFSAGSTGYTECQWDRLGGGLTFDADNNLYSAQGGAEDFSAVLILKDPAAVDPNDRTP